MSRKAEGFGKRNRERARTGGTGDDLARLCKLTCELGAVEAKVIRADSIVTAPWVRMKCRFGCDGYGECLMCPPYSPAPEETRAVVSGFRRAILIHGDDSTDITAVASRLEREAFLGGWYKALGMGAGPCRLCSTCNTGKTCRHPCEARPSMEASGIDVYQTARNNSFPIEVLRSQREKGNYYGLVLID